MTLKKVHYLSGVTISIFVALHLFNHFFALFGAAEHIEMMDKLRLIYRNIIAETILLFAVGIQIISGFKLFRKNRKSAKRGFDKLQIWTGLYLALFFIIHLSAVLAGRYVLHLDTNFYFGVAGLNTFPLNLFFIPYYGLAIFSFFGHIASIHYKKMRINILNITPKTQAKIILALGFILTIILLYGLTNHFQGVQIPEEYHILIGK